MVRRSRSRRWGRVAKYGVACILICGASAAPTIPGAVDPGRVQNEFKVPSAPKATSEGISTPDTPGAIAPPGAEDATFVLHQVIVEGATVFAAEEFRPLYEKQLNRKISVKDLDGDSIN